MDNKRVQEIIRSLGVIEVSLGGRPVWIEDLDGSLAQVRFLDDSSSFKVPVGELQEN
ncbi:H-type small acid-soluble spore protein [Syntrophomonas curvata]